jgi:hypothetical protein
VPHTAGHQTAHHHHHQQQQQQHNHHVPPSSGQHHSYGTGFSARDHTPAPSLGVWESTVPAAATATAAATLSHLLRLVSHWLMLGSPINRMIWLHRCCALQQQICTAQQLSG